MNLRNFACALCVVWFGTATAVAQKGTAGPGFYPQGFHGDTWTGEVASAGEAKRELTLTYKSGDKTQTFIAYVPDGGAAWGRMSPGTKCSRYFQSISRRRTSHRSLSHRTSIWPI